jgi:hypothetical protein
MKSAVCVALVLWGAAACRSSSPLFQGSDSGTSYGGQAGALGGNTSLVSGGYAAAHTPLPQVNRHAGVVLANVELVSISYPQFQFANDVNKWGDFVFGSAWFGVGRQYGVKSGMHARAVTPSGNLPSMMSSDALLQQLDALIAAGAVPAPKTTKSDQYLYMIYVPKTTTVVGSVGTSCVDYLGYHGSASYQGTVYPYALAVDCGSGLDDLLSTASHELMEAATDPYDGSDAGYYLDVSLPDPWYADSGYELGDLCDGEPNATEDGFALQPIWSNAAAAAGEDPCAPVTRPAFADFSVAPALVPTVAAGSSVSFTLTGWSLAVAEDWPLGVAAAPNSDLSLEPMQPLLSANEINNGKTVTLTLTVPANAISGHVGAVEVRAPGGLPRSWPVAFRVE